MENFTENVLLQVVKKHSFSKSISMNLNFLLLPTSTINSPPPPLEKPNPKKPNPQLSGLHDSALDACDLNETLNIISHKLRIFNFSLSCGVHGLSRKIGFYFPLKLFLKVFR